MAYIMTMLQSYPRTVFSSPSRLLRIRSDFHRDYVNAFAQYQIEELYVMESAIDRLF